MKRIRGKAVIWAAALSSGLACSDGAHVLGGSGETTSGGAANGSKDGSSDADPSGDPGRGGAPDVPAAIDEGDGEPGMANESSAGSDRDPASPSEADVGEPVAPETAFVTPRGPCEVAERVGGFSIEKQVDFGVVQGVVAEGVVPTAVPRVDRDEGACKLFERRTLSCIPACVGAETCGEEGACIPYPRQVSVGEVTITGLTRETKMSPLAPANSYFSPGADNPPYAVGSEIILSAAGAGDEGAFQLFGVGSEPLRRAPSWRLEPGTDLTVEWEAPASAVPATVLVELSIDQHGSSPLSLSCEFADTGSAVVPAAVVDRLLEAGVSGFPNGRITRRTADHVELGVGCVELVVGSPLSASVAVVGFTPCNGSEECPEGQVCNVALQRCE